MRLPQTFLAHNTSNRDRTNPRTNFRKKTEVSYKPQAAVCFEKQQNPILQKLSGRGLAFTTNRDLQSQICKKWLFQSQSCQIPIYTNQLAIPDIYIDYIHQNPHKNQTNNSLIHPIPKINLMFVTLPKLSKNTSRTIYGLTFIRK